MDANQIMGALDNEKMCALGNEMIFVLVKQWAHKNKAKLNKKGGNQ